MKFFQRIAALVVAAVFVALPASGANPPTYYGNVVGNYGNGINNFYISTTGVDTGFCTSPGSPCLTITYALENAMMSSQGGHQSIINFGTGTWNETVNVDYIAPFAGEATQDNPSILFNGNGASNTIWNGGNSSCGVLIANQGSSVAVQNLTFQATGNVCQSAIFAEKGGFVQVLGGMAFGVASEAHLDCEDQGSDIQLWQNYTINGSAANHINSGPGCHVKYNNGPVVTLSGTPSFSGGFVSAEAALVSFGGTTFSGSATGQRYNLQADALIVINSGGTACASLPGNVAPSQNGNSMCWQNGTSGTCAPSVTSLTSGTSTYTTPLCNGQLATAVQVRLVGGGGGGSGSGTAGGTATAGHNTTFGALQANGGGAGSLGAAGAGGASSGGNLLNTTGQTGALGPTNSGISQTGGSGGSAPLGFGGSGAGNNTGGAGTACGGGGQGGGTGASTSTGTNGNGGGGGGYVEHLYTIPAATFSYAVGASAAGGTAGTLGNVGGAGAAGCILIVATWSSSSGE